MDTEAEEIIDFKALRAKFQKSDIIKNKCTGKQPSQASEAPGVSDTKTVLNVTNIHIIETIATHNAIVQQVHATSPCPPIPLAKPVIVPKPVLLRLADWTKPSVPAESGGRAEDFTASNPASLGISPNKFQKPINETSEPRTSEDNKENDQMDKITFKEKLNIWESSLHCTVASSAPAQKIKCATLPPSLLNSGPNSSFLSKSDGPLFRDTSFTQSKKEDLSMGPEVQISGAWDQISQPKEPTMLIQSRDCSQTTNDYEITVPSLPPEINLSKPPIGQKGFKLENNNTVESEPSPELPPRFIRLDLANDPEPNFLMDRGEGAACEKDHQHTSLQRRELPSIAVLGPPPVKPPRPFKVDLNALQNIKIDSCSPMESSKKNGIPSSLLTRPEEYNILSTGSTPEETNNKKKQQHREKEQKNELQNRDTREKRQDQVKECENNEKREKELQKKFNLTGLEIPILKAQVQEHLKGGKLSLTVKRGEIVEIIRMVECPTGSWLAKTQAGNYGYIQIDAVKMDNAEIKEISKRMSQQPQTFEEIYDDIGLSEITVEPYTTSPFHSADCGQLCEAMDMKKESEKKSSANKMNPLTKMLHKGKEKKRKGHESLSQAPQSEFGSAASIYDDAISKMMTSQTASSQNHFADEESLHEQIYDDVETNNSDANSRSQSTLSITNLESSESSVYEDVHNIKEHNDSEDKTSKSDTIKISWGKIFKKREENAKRTGEMNTELEESERLYGGNEDGFTMDAKANREKVKGIFKGKRKDLNEEKETKVDKKKILKEQEFREKFNYTKEISVENIAFVEHNVVQEKKGSLYLPIKSREKLDVIDIGEGNQIICRNAEGKYGYVHVRHLIFGNQK
uniref:FYN-binding protein 1-like isoform X3 n=1 Tax=Pristiophorus japonicus TaxID=55135 RepID=UPI00398E5F01